jgi:hypothetical protein
VGGFAPVEVGESPSAAQELTAWLSALPTFFDLKNHPLGDVESTYYSSKNYVDETRILKLVLRRCLHLCLIPHVEEYAAMGANGDSSSQTQPALTGELTQQPQDNPLSLVWGSLSELYGVCRALMETSKIDLRSWSSLGSLLNREIETIETLIFCRRLSPDQILQQRLPELYQLSESARARAAADDVCAVLSSFAYCLDQLSFVSTWLSHDRPIKMTLPIFTHVHARARASVSLLEKIALKAAAEGGEFYELFDSAGYAVGMELNKVFSHELVGLAASHHPAAIYTKIENSHGLLRDCFQQTILTLAQVFDPTLDGSKMFDALHTKLQQSLELRADLWAISELVKRAERELKPLAPLATRLQAFQNGAMRHLMYKDWESFERFIAEISAARGAAELGPVLHRFATYLDALFNQISMRAVLAEHPFDYPRVNG